VADLGGHGSEEPPPRASHHCLKPPSVMLSWQNIV